MSELKVAQLVSDLAREPPLPICIALGHLADKDRPRAVSDHVDSPDETVNATREQADAIAGWWTLRAAGRLWARRSPCL